jgi:D-alanine-D-alanine ligase
MSLLNVGLIFGGQSAEHEVSIDTAQIVRRGLRADRYRITPIYIAKSGGWFTGDLLIHPQSYRDLENVITGAQPIVFSSNPAKRGLLLLDPRHPRLPDGENQYSCIQTIDIAFPVIHGPNGEDGTIQGLFELADIPYTGSDVTASAIAINKVKTKAILRNAKIPVLNDFTVSTHNWQRNPSNVILGIEECFNYPIFIKPIRLGSSIGVSFASNRVLLAEAIELALRYDTDAMAEPAQQNFIEITCSVVGDSTECLNSLCEQTIQGKGAGGFLRYQDKYQPGSGSRGTKPAPISADLTSRIQRTAIRTFQEIGATGVARVDFLVHPKDDTFYVSEINTLPGALSFQLWEASDFPLSELLDKLIIIAIRRSESKRRCCFFPLEP